MSNYWDLWCLDCDERHGFDNMNRQNKNLAALAKHAAALAALLPLSEMQEVDLLVQSTYSGGHVNLRWFAKHAGHRLAAKDECGREEDSCYEWFKCPACGTQKSCALLKGHPGEHAEKRPLEPR